MPKLSWNAKSCPFCDSDEIRYSDKGSDAALIEDHLYWCANCGAFGPNDLSEKRAAEMWNLRRPMAEVERQRDELLAACKAMLTQLKFAPPSMPEKVTIKSVRRLRQASGQARAAIAAIEDPLTRPGVTWEELGRGFIADEPDQTYGAAD